MPGRAPGHPTTSSDTQHHLAKCDICSHLCAEADTWVTEEGLLAKRISGDTWGVSVLGREPSLGNRVTTPGPAPGLPLWALELWPLGLGRL